MSLSIDSNDSRYIDGVYEGQFQPVLLGNQNRVFTQFSGKLGKHFIGIQKGDSFVNVRAFYETDGLKNTGATGPNSYFSYIQAGQLRINGMPIPLVNKPEQIFFESRVPLRLSSPFGPINPNQDYWWIEGYNQKFEEMFFPYQALTENKNMDRRDLYFYPADYGNYVRQRPNPTQLYPAEAINPSIIGQNEIDNVPVDETPNQITEAVDILNNDEEFFLDENIIASGTIDHLEDRIFDFYDRLIRAVKSVKYPVINQPTFQYYPDFLILRGNVVSDYDREWVYVYTFTTNVSNIGVKAYKFDFKPGLPDSIMKGVIEGYLDLEISKPIAQGSIPSNYSIVLNFLNTLQNNLATKDNPVNIAKNYSIQPAGSLLFIRDTFDENGDEQILAGKFNEDGAFDIYAIDIIYYFDLMEDTGVENVTDDPLNIALEDESYINRQAPYLEYYTPDELEAFMQNNQINITIDTSERMVLHQRNITALCLVDPDNKKVFIYDGFYWEFGRVKNPDDEDWSDVIFNPNTNIKLMGGMNRHLQRLMSKINLQLGAEYTINFQS